MNLFQTKERADASLRSAWRMTALGKTGITVSRLGLSASYRPGK